MKLRSFSAILLAAGLLLILGGAGLPLAVGAPDVIGGAGSPSYWFFVRHKLHDAPIALVLLGAASVLIAVFCLLFSGTVKRCCTPGTSVLAVALSACVAAGLGCVMEFIACIAFGSLGRHPIALPLSFFGGVTAFFALLGFAWLYGKRRKLAPSGKGLFLDVLAAVVSFPGFFYGFCCLTGFLADLF